MTAPISGSSNRKWLWLSIVAIAAAGTWFAFRWIDWKRGESAGTLTKSTDRKKQPAKVSICIPLLKPIVEWDEFPGRLEAVESVEVRSRVSGYLKISNFKEGQKVERGQVLAEIDPRPFQAELKRSESNALESRAKLQQAITAIDQAKAEAERAAARQELTRKQVERMRSLRLQNAVSQDELDVAEAAAIEAEANLIVARSSIKSAEANLTAAEAGVEITDAAVKIAELNLSYTQIIAPISGLIGQRFITEGNMVSGGTNESTLITTIVTTDPIHCYFDADETTYLKYTKLAKDGIRPSSRDVLNPVYVALADDRKSFPYKGHMDFVDNRFDRQTGTIRGRAILPNPDSTLAPGMFVRLRLPGGPERETLLIPDKAVGTDQAEKFVIVVNDRNIAEKRFIKLGPISHGLRIVREGLDGNEKIVVSGLQRVKPNGEVEIVETEDVLFIEDSLPDTYQPYTREDAIVPEKLPAANAVENAEPTSESPRSDDNDPTPRAPKSGS